MRALHDLDAVLRYVKANLHSVIYDRKSNAILDHPSLNQRAQFCPISPEGMQASPNEAC
jgi:hypothetical protein